MAFLAFCQAVRREALQPLLLLDLDIRIFRDNYRLLNLGVSSIPTRRTDPAPSFRTSQEVMYSK
jgi:hypothetical protein